MPVWCFSNLLFCLGLGCLFRPLVSKQSGALDDLWPRRTRFGSLPRGPPNPHFHPCVWSWEELKSNVCIDASRKEIRKSIEVGSSGIPALQISAKRVIGTNSKYFGRLLLIRNWCFGYAFEYGCALTDPDVCNEVRIFLTDASCFLISTKCLLFSAELSHTVTIENTLVFFYHVILKKNEPL